MCGIVDDLKADLDRRAAVGLEKYGVPLSGATDNIAGRIKHMVEELEDGALYGMWLLRALVPKMSDGVIRSVRLPEYLIEGTVLYRDGIFVAEYRSYGEAEAAAADLWLRDVQKAAVG